LSWREPTTGADGSAPAAGPRRGRGQRAPASSAAGTGVSVDSSSGSPPSATPGGNIKRPPETKKASPPGRPIIERPRLIRQLEETKASTVLLVAPAGYGKTTLLRHWAQRHPGICWYTAEAGSSDLAVLAIGLARALESVSQGLYAYLSQVIRALSNPSRQVTDVVEAFITSLADSPATTAVIDDYHLLSDSSSAETLVRELRDQLELRLFVGSRVRPEWATARAEIYGDIFELGPDELALNADETTELLAESPGTVTSELLVKANGWPAVIGLAALARPTSRTPSDAPSSTLFRFFAEELFTAAPASLQEHMPTMALLPSLALDLVEEVFGGDAAALLDAAVAQGFATVEDDDHELHPLIREYLLSKLGLRSDADEQVKHAVVLSLGREQWDHAFELITRFGRIDLLESLVEQAFKPLIRSGRIGTLEQIATFARSRSADFSPLITLIDAELAFRDGRFARAEALANRAGHALRRQHDLGSRAHLIAGHGALLQSNYEIALNHFSAARATATDADQTRDALWGLAMTSIYSEKWDPNKHVSELQRHRDDSPTALLCATTASLTLRRYTTGFTEPIDTESALHVVGGVPDPRVRTSFTNVYAYEMILRAEYQSALVIAEQMYEDATAYRLGWIIPHAEWALAASLLGLRDFPQADRWLQRVELIGSKLRDGHLIFNAAMLRARFLLTLQRADEALDALRIDDSHPTNPAMRAELWATRALVSGVLNDRASGSADADRAQSMTSSVDVRALLACARALYQPSTESSLAAFRTAEQLGAWDALVCTMRAQPRLLVEIAEIEACQPRLRSLLLRCNDFDLARSVGMEIGVRPRHQRSPLSPRETEVHKLIRQGLTNREIAKLLFISEATVKVHVRHIFEKTGARTRTEAATRFGDNS
jgi:LuxR family maltose regulon positive regulatory protein